jgi:phytoene dehydrogenase-like protein
LRPLKEAARLKRLKYAKYAIPPQVFFPLPFGRTNVLSEEILDFCEFTSRHFPSHTDVARKLRATFSRAITVGVARTTNLAFRRLQLSVAARVGVSGISSLALRNPFSLAPLRRSFPKSPLLSLQTESRLRAQLATVLRGSSEDSHESLLLLSARGRLCEDSASSVED